MPGVSYVVEAYSEFDCKLGLEIVSDCRVLESVSEEESMVNICAVLEALAGLFDIDKLVDIKLPEVRISELVSCRKLDVVLGETIEAEEPENAEVMDAALPPETEPLELITTTAVLSGIVYPLLSLESLSPAIGDEVPERGLVLPVIVAEVDV